MAVNIQMFHSFMKHWIGIDMDGSFILTKQRDGFSNRNIEVL